MRNLTEAQQKMVEQLLANLTKLGGCKHCKPATLKDLTPEKRKEVATIRFELNLFDLENDSEAEHEDGLGEIEIGVLTGDQHCLTWTDAHFCECKVEVTTS